MPGTSRRALAALAVDGRALRHSAPFRRLWLGQLVSVTGRQITVVAVPFELYQLTHSPAIVGAAGLAQAIPLLASAVLFGSFVDRVDRRRLLLATQLVLALCSVGLCINAAQGHPSVVAIFALVAAAAAISALDSPSRTAIIPNIVEPDHLSGALALNFGLMQVAIIGGPAIGGLVLAHGSVSFAFGIDAATFVAALIAVALLPSQRALGGGDAADRGIAAIRRGATFVRGQPVILGGFALDLVAMIFGLPRALFPALAAGRFASTGVTGLGLLYSAPGVGALLAVLTAGWIGRIEHRGRVIPLAVIAWGLSIIAFGLAPTLPLALLALAIAGGADSYSAVARNTTMQQLTPDHLRGRLSAVYFTVVAGGPYLGDLEAGSVASLTSVRFSVLSGGGLCVAGAAAIALAFPALWRYSFGSSSEAPESA